MSYNLNVVLAGSTKVTSHYKVDLVEVEKKPAILFELLDLQTKPVNNWEKSDYQEIKELLKMDFDNLPIYWISPHYPDYQFTDDTEFR